MHSHPFAGLPADQIEILQSLIKSDDFYHVVHRRRFARTIQVLIEQAPTGRLLEIGTSGVIPDALTVLAPDLTVTVTNFDMDKPTHHEYISQTQEVYPAYRVDLEHEPFPCPDETFDWVLCCEVIEHMEIDPMAMMSEINRVLKPGGHLLLTTPNVVSARGLHKMLSGIEPHFYMQYNKDRSYHRHNYEYSIHTMYAVLRASGFNGTIWTEDCFEDGMPSVVERLTKAGYVISHTGDNIMALCRKTGPVVDRHPREIYV